MVGGGRGPRQGKAKVTAASSIFRTKDPILEDQKFGSGSSNAEGKLAEFTEIRSDPSLCVFTFLLSFDICLPP